MATKGRRTHADYRRHLALGAALVTLVSAFTSLAESRGWEHAWTFASASLAAGAGAVVWWTVRDELARRRQMHDHVLDRIVIAPANDSRPPLLKELTAYDLGADEEALGGDGEAAEYIPRDRDDDLERALAAARDAQGPRMVVLRGPSKSGKSRTLFEVARRDPVLREATVIAPRTLKALAAILDDGRPAPRTGRLLIWLDDLERFVSAAHGGMDRDALHELATWRQPIVIVATAGGKGSDRQGETGLSVPIQQLYGLRRVTYVSLRSELSPNEDREVTRRFSPDVAQQMRTHGIGEYLVAAPELARKLEEERHKPGDDECPEGAAVAWAAIDWARCGMRGSISEARLRALWPHYLRGVHPTDERFAAGLRWALKPVYRSVALVYETNSYEAYDWIVAHANARMEREINRDALDRILREVEPEAAVDCGVAAYEQDATEESERAFRRGLDSSDDRAAATSAFNLGYLLAERGDTGGAATAYERALAAPEPETAAKAGVNLGILRQQNGEREQAAQAYRRAIELDVPTHSASAALNLGVLLDAADEVDDAVAAFAAAERSDDAAVRCRAAFLRGNVLLEAGASGAEQAFRRALAGDDPEIAPAAAYLLAGLLEEDDPAGARSAYERVAASENPGLASLAADRLQALGAQANGRGAHADDRAAFAHALKLDEAGDADAAQAAYAELARSASSDLAAAAAFSLAVLLRKRGDDDAARHAYEQAIAAGHPRITPAALYGLGALLADTGEPDARAVLERAAQAEDPSIATAARTELERMP